MNILFYGVFYLHKIGAKGVNNGMNDREYISTQNQLMFVASVVKDLDLDEFLEWINKAEAIGLIVDPSLYRAAAANLCIIKGLAEAANVLRQEAMAHPWPIALM